MSCVPGIDLLVPPTVVYGPVVAALMAAALYGRGALVGSAFLALGLLLWTTGEYLVHRFVEHGPFRRVQYIDNHACHHADPDDASKFVYSLSQTLVALPVVFGFSWALHWELFGALATTVGITLGYLVNEWLHFCSHRPQLLESRAWLRWMTRNHRLHHGENAARYFGFFTTLWDRVFRTHGYADGVSDQALSGRRSSE